MAPKKREFGKATNLAPAYSFDPIDQLCWESIMREAGIQAFLSDAGVAPLTIAYEDFIRDYERTVLNVLAYLGLDTTAVTIAAPFYEPLTDELSEEWVQRFRHQRQQEWENRGW